MTTPDQQLPPWAESRYGAIFCPECEADRGYGSGGPTELKQAIDSFLHESTCSRTPRKPTRDEMLDRVTALSRKPYLLVPFAEGVEIRMAADTRRLRPDAIRSLRADLAKWLVDRGYPVEDP